MFTFATSLLFSHVQVLVGYAICVLFPLPWLNRAILDLWQQIGATVTTFVATTLGRVAPSASLPSPSLPSAAPTAAPAAAPAVAPADPPTAAN